MSSKALKRHEFKDEDAPHLAPSVLEAATDDRFQACEIMFKVSDKNGDLVPCKIRELIARHYEASGEISLWLKSRQEFLTTSIDCLFYQDMVDFDGIKVLALNLNEKKALENFRRVQAFEANRHPILKELTLTTQNDEEIAYAETRGSFKSATIKNDSTEAAADLLARSGTYHRVRFTEAAFSRHYKVAKKAALDTMPRSNRKFVAETTGNGAQGGFYDDFMEVVTHGRPHPSLPNCWILGNVTAHFLAWFQHDEYCGALAPLNLDSLPAETRHILEEHEKEHVAEMQRFGYTPDAIEACLAWRRAAMRDEKNLLTDPVGACKNMNREYPATYRHAFQSTGQAWFSLTLIDTLREYFKRENERLGLPVYLDFIHEKGKRPEPISGRRFMIFEMPVLGWKYRYCGFLDPSAGHEDGDPACFKLLDRVLRKVAAVFHGAYGPREAARMAMALSAWYDYGLINWENNSLGLGCTEEFLEAVYTNLYKGEPDRVDLGAYGWSTGPGSREVMVARGKTHFEHPHHPVRNPYGPFYGEAGQFQVPPGKTKPVAVTGHDDTVMSYCGLVMTDLSMPDPVPPTHEHTMRPGEVSVHGLAKLNLGAGAQANAQRRTAGFRNFGRG